MPTLSNIGQQASTLSGEKFAEELSRHVSLTASEIAELFPTPADREELGRLVTIVDAAAAENIKKAQLVERASSMAGAILKIVSKVLKPV
jgi:hypothetical protein